MKIFWDFDGTLYEFRKGLGPDEFAKAGYSRTLNLLSASIVSVLSRLDGATDYNGNKVEHYLLSAVVNDDAIADKKWVIKYDGLPIREENMIFVPYGKSKADALRAAGIEIDKSDLFIDDYTKNLEDMESLMTCVKILNGINDTHRSWRGSRISAFSSPKAIAKDLLAISYASTVPEIAA